MAATMDGIMKAIFSCIPAAPSSAADSCLSADFSSNFPGGGGGGGGEDRISCLPDALLSNIVSRLPVKDAARTAAISPRWRRLRSSTPLVLVDADIFHDYVVGDGHGHDGLIDWRGLTRTVSRILSGHQGPFRTIHLTTVCNYAAARGGSALVRWLHLFAAKAVEELVLVNFPRWPLDNTLPAEVLRVASLRRLYLGLWDEFPDTDHLPRGAHVFPHLLELGFCRTDIKDKDLDSLLQRSPVLEKLALILNYATPRNVRVRSRSLRCVLFWMSIADGLDVAVAPRLERLILWNDCPGACFDKSFRTRVKIGNTPALKVLGYLEPSIHVLEIRNTVIEFGTKASPTTTLTSVKILGLRVRFGMHRETKALPTFLRCFPKVETLHIMSAEADEPTGKLNFKFWQDVGPLQCLQSHIKKVVFKNFRGYRSELAFLRFVVERAQLLQNMVIVLADDSKEGVAEKLKPLACSTKRASRDPKFMILVRKGGSPWSFRVASDLSKSDPFDC
ncbi:putative F-box/FBD/LRR-repeat protein At5g22670 [Lolium rigidum]|uniref:putative F-box/FBD/LRR-repeat protein At5g22670 n=1 Tax=Lolium rigidum TaxID=89674 RepID=UPI001F5C44AC|nr:putative F-box/FBD/LRR-repeat protein At5g22670 [Lolium rigidum]